MGSGLQKTAEVARVIHVSVAMFSAVMLVLFAVSGFMFLHADMFGIDSADRANVTTADKPMPLQIADKASRREVTNYLHERLALTGTLERFDVYTLGGEGFGGDAGVIDLTLKNPSGSVTVLISRKTGEMHMTTRRMNLAAMLGNLHRGTSTGPRWRMAIDVAAICLLAVCVSGIIMCLADPRRRALGLAALIAGLAVWAGAYAFLVP